MVFRTVYTTAKHNQELCHLNKQWHIHCVNTVPGPTSRSNEAGAHMYVLVKIKDQVDENHFP